MARIKQKTIQGIGGRLSIIRKYLGFSIPQMAGALGLSYDGYYKNESNQASPGYFTLQRLQQNHDVSMDWLMFGKGPMFFNNKPLSTETLLGSAANFPELKELMNAMEQDVQLRHEILVYYYKYKNNKNPAG
jgi:transcriptional regulator with XRE-family HTH domain